MSVLSAKQLEVQFGSRVALAPVDLDFQLGEFVALVGPNGAGKTTTIHILTGVITASAGEVEVLGMSVPDEIHEVKQQIGVVPDAA